MNKFLSLFALLIIPGALSFAAPNPVIEGMANGMSLLKPIFGAEAKLQAAVLGKLSSVDEGAIAAELLAERQTNKVLIYTYAISPFSTEAVSILDSTGYAYTKIELGVEWFLLGGVTSVKRVLLSEQAENGATSLPKIFIGGKCLGGCAELAAAAKNGELETMLKKSGAKKV